MSNKIKIFKNMFHKMFSRSRASCSLLGHFPRFRSRSCHFRFLGLGQFLNFRTDQRCLYNTLLHGFVEGRLGHSLLLQVDPEVERAAAGVMLGLRAVLQLGGLQAPVNDVIVHVAAGDSALVVLSAHIHQHLREHIHGEELLANGSLEFGLQSPPLGNIFGHFELFFGRLFVLLLLQHLGQCLVTEELQFAEVLEVVGLNSVDIGQVVCKELDLDGSGAHHTGHSSAVSHGQEISSVFGNNSGHTAFEVRIINSFEILCTEKKLLITSIMKVTTASRWAWVGNIGVDKCR